MSPLLRLRRILLNAATGLSLLLCLATAGTWVRSYFVRDVVQIWDANEHSPANHLEGPIVVGVRTVETCEGHLGVDRFQTFSKSTAGPPPRWRHEQTPPDETDLWSRHLRADQRALSVPGIVYVPADDRSGWPYLLLLHLAYPTLLFGVAPAVWLVVFHRRRRRGDRRARAGLCPACGYDLRATPLGVRCPECGTVAKARDARAASPRSRSSLTTDH